MKYGVDMSFPPTPAQARYIANSGWSFCGVYVGGPRALAGNSWHQVDGARYPVRDISVAFNEFLPIYVGRNVGDDPSRPWDSRDKFTYAQGQSDGAQANIYTGACGFGPDTLLCLDVEYGTYQAHPYDTEEYVRGWVSEVNSAGHKAVLYSDPQTIGDLGHPDLVDYTWAAQWVKSQNNVTVPPFGRFDPRIPPPWDIWQFGSGRIGNVQCDVNSCADDVILAKYG